MFLVRVLGLPVISGVDVLCCVQANDIYLEMAIGNAPWPIGVTMVGIHARTGREKIFAQNVARILSEQRPCMQCYLSVCASPQN